MSNRPGHKKNHRYPRQPRATGARQISYTARMAVNWRVVRTGADAVLALEAGRDHEHVFTGGTDPFWDAVQFAASCLRGETDPAALS